MKISTHYAYGCKLYLKLLRRVIQLNHSPAFNKRKSGKSSRTLSGFERHLRRRRTLPFLFYKHAVGLQSN